MARTWSPFSTSATSATLSSSTASPASSSSDGLSRSSTSLSSSSPALSSSSTTSSSARRLRLRSPAAATPFMSSAPSVIAVLCAAALILRTPATTAATVDDAAYEDIDEEADVEGGGVLAILRSLVRATTTRLSSLVLGAGPGTYDDDADDDDEQEAAAAVPVPAGARVRYRDYQLLRVQLRSKRSGAQVRQLAQRHPGAQVWSQARRQRTADLLVPPAEAAALEDALDDLGLQYRVVMSDVQKIISLQNPPRPTAQQRTTLLRNVGHPFTWKRFHRYDDIVEYMHWLASSYPHLAQVLTIGTSSEGRPLYLLKVSTREARSDLALPRDNGTAEPRRAAGTQGKKPAVWLNYWITYTASFIIFVCSTHAREWITPAAALYVCMQLVERFYSHPHLVLDADWYILPVLNPDGYEYAHARDRLWRKSRSSHEVAAGLRDGGGPGGLGLARLASLFHKHKRGPCSGVDLNRNWEHNWGDRVGASDDPCSESYAGPRPFSEPETRAVAAFISRRRERVQLFVTLHSYGQLWLIPDGAGYGRLPDHQELYNKAKLAAGAMRRVRNTRYHIGTSPEVLYPISGGSANWAKNLPDRGRYGFLLPASFIVPTGKEAFAGLKELTQAIVCRNNVY
ncbi:hypothetical protein FOCC_FOCC001570 [Frankliniella occidentalis]|nr:hypothetical protein FOCC_FOCC001570 [Frankliniella occidentalis]